MAFVDEIRINAKAGNGGDGVVRWLHEKGKEYSGPAGGNGGRGGDVFFVASSDLALLSNYRHQKFFKAVRGTDGGGKSLFGENGDDCVIEVPVGSIITDLTRNKKYELRSVGEKIKVLEGGRGGLGNEHFKGSKNISPEEFTLGKEGEEADFYIELELVADIGIIGLPNAGKSSLLNSITNSRAKVGNFQFTTLEPNLGSLYGVILADVPGLIEGAAEGKGLGHKFLRHVRRTNLLLHCIAADTENFDEAYTTVRKELEKFDEELAKKEEIILITKTDMVDEKTVEDLVKKYSKTHKVLTVSILDDESLKSLSDTLVKIVKK